MKKVVIIAPDFAPSSLPPAIRARFFANSLSEFGWHPTVLATDPNYYDWKIDPENEKLVAAEVSVCRTGAWRSSWTRRLGVGDLGMRSFWNQWQQLKKICKAGKVDLIFIPVPPYISMALGRLAYQKFGIPYVIDYIDPWVTEYYWKVPKKDRPPKWPFAYALSRVVEPFALKHVSHITGVSEGTTDGVIQRYKHLSTDDATEIPYGASTADFEYVRSNPRKNPIFQKDDGYLHLSYVGACIPGMHPTVRAIFRAVKLGLETNPEVFSKLRLHFVGTSYASDGNARSLLPEIAREFGIEQLVDERSARVAYLDSLQIMLDSNALFLVGSDEAHYTASKVFPYMLAQRPLLAVFHEQSSVVQILKSYGASEVVTFGGPQTLNQRTQDICNSLLSLLNRRTLEVDLGKIEPYTIRSMTQRLAKVFDKAVEPATQSISSVVAGSLGPNVSA